METYVIAINFFSEPHFQGNCSRYYFVSKRGKRVKMEGIERAKRYRSEVCAKKTARQLSEIYPDALILVI